MVLDASAAVELLLTTLAGRRLAGRLSDESEAIHVPHLIDLEIAQVFRRYARRAALSEERGRRALSLWRDLDAERYSHEPFLAAIWRLRNNFTAYDAMYVALAQTLRTVLLTADRRLAAAPGMAGRIELI